MFSQSFRIPAGFHEKIAEKHVPLRPGGIEPHGLPCVIDRSLEIGDGENARELCPVRT